MFGNTEASRAPARRGWATSRTSSAASSTAAVTELDASTRTARRASRTMFGTDFWSWLARIPTSARPSTSRWPARREQNAERLADARVARRRDRRRRGRRQRFAARRLLRLQPSCAESSSTCPRPTATRAFGDRIEFVAGSFFERVRSATLLLSGSSTTGTTSGDGDPAHDPCSARPAHASSHGVRLSRKRARRAKWLDLLMLTLAVDASARAAVACAARRRRARAGLDPGRAARGAMPLTVGTAGHIDHGKTWLVRALTGKDTDRLPEEQRRGISIDLGYAPLELADGRRLSVVDVPGPRALRAHDGRRRHRHRPLPARRRRGRGRASADARAPRDPAAARHRARRRRGDEGRTRSTPRRSSSRSTRRASSCRTRRSSR